MSADERITLIQHKIDRAKYHITDLQNAIDQFFKSEAPPYEIRNKIDQQTHRRIYYVSRVDPTPATFATITGDAIQSLRNALDHLAYQLFLVSTNGTMDGRHVYFPIDCDAAEYRRNLSRRTRGMRPDVINMFNHIEPYKNGKGHQLWVLHELSNLDKHRLLVPVASRFQSVNIGPIMQHLMEKNKLPSGMAIPKIPDLFLLPADNLCPLKVDDVLFDGRS